MRKVKLITILILTCFVLSNCGFKVVDKYLVPWSDPAEPTHSTYTRIWQDQFANDWAGVLFRTIRQIIH